MGLGVRRAGEAGPFSAFPWLREGTSRTLGTLQSGSRTQGLSLVNVHCVDVKTDGMGRAEPPSKTGGVQGQGTPPSKASSYLAAFKYRASILVSTFTNRNNNHGDINSHGAPASLIGHSGKEAMIGKDARLGFEPGTARHEASWGIGLQGGRVPRGGIQAFEVLGVHSRCTPFLRFIVDGMRQKLCPSGPGGRGHPGSRPALPLREVSSANRKELPSLSFSFPR